MKKLKQILCFVAIICTLFTTSSCWGTNTPTNATTKSNTSIQTNANTKSKKESSKSSLVECPSCHKKVNKLIRKEVFAGNGDYKSWCSACWKEFNSLNIYK